MTASSNFGNVFSVLVSSAFIPFLPMLPVQLLVLNLLYDFSQLSLPWDRMDVEFLRYLEGVLQRVGAARSGVIDEGGVVLAGNGFRKAAMQAGFRQALIVDADGRRS